MFTDLIQERFWGFLDVHCGSNDQSVFNIVVAEMKDFSYRSKLVGETYGRAAVMASALNADRVKAVAQSAEFVHCSAH